MTGQEETLRLLGGKRLVDLPLEYLPQPEDLPGDLARIAREVESFLPGQGVRLTLALCQIFPGQTIYFRNPGRWLRAWRDQVIRNVYDEGGETIKTLATATGLSCRQIEIILAQSPEPPSQQRWLF